MGMLLFFLFIFVPLMELWLLIELGHVIGGFSTIMLVIVTAAIGAALAKSQGLLILQKINREFATGQMPSDALFDGLLILVGGIVLLTPGLITDSIGFFLMIPYGRSIIKKIIRRKVEEAFQNGRTIHVGYYKSE